jgi:predicted regulator of Ras-like GTPase activity (Roadblock/LC7/MglB family)
MSLLNGILADFASMEGVLAAALVDDAGFVIETTSEVIDSRVLGPMTATSVAVAKSFLSYINRIPGTIMIETDIGFVSITPLTQDEALAVVANSRVCLGKVRYKVQKMRPAIMEAIVI